MNSFVHFALLACILVTIDACSPAPATNATATYGRKKRELGFSVDSETLLSDAPASVAFTIVNLAEIQELLGVLKPALVNNVDTAALKETLQTALDETPVTDSRHKTQIYFLGRSLTEAECTDLTQASTSIFSSNLLSIRVKC